MAVYMIQGGGPEGHVKIGYSHSPKQRLASLQTSSQTKLRIIRILEGHVDVEWELHQRFEHLREVGEWFRFAPEMLSDLGYVDLPMPTAAKRGRPPLLDESALLTPVHVRLAPRVFAIMQQRAADDDRPLAYYLRCIINAAADEPERLIAPTLLAAD
ncbi:MAG TPA: GIY-YIG nuclease family protein [Acetobacteraceae bacterium]|jgi:hypothetical protein|nr:GIY-YIG nuclease family protein [Acetobacteraceae bacterium]